MVIESFSSTINDNDIQELAIGRFDGMHIAHQSIFARLDKNSGAILVIDVGYSNITPHRYKQKHTTLPILFLKLENIKDTDGLDFIKNLKDIKNTQYPLKSVYVTKTTVFLKTF